MLFDFMDKLKYVPYKMGEPKRLMALGLGVVGLAAGYSLKSDEKWEGGWKMFLMTFGAVAIAAYIAGVINPVTLYNRSHYGTTEWGGKVVGQGTETMPAGWVDAYGAVWAPGVRKTGRLPFMPAASRQDPAQPAMATVTENYGSTTEWQGEVVGQGTKAMPAGWVDAYGAQYEPGRAPLYYGANVVGCNPLTGEGCNEVPPTSGDIYIRDVGEIEFNGGI